MDGWMAAWPFNHTRSRARLLLSAPGMAWPGRYLASRAVMVDVSLPVSAPLKESTTAPLEYDRNVGTALMFAAAAVSPLSSTSIFRNVMPSLVCLSASSAKRGAI